MKRIILMILLCLTGIVSGYRESPEPDPPEVSPGNRVAAGAGHPAHRPATLPGSPAQVSTHTYRNDDRDSTSIPEEDHVTCRRLFHGAVLLAALAFTRCIILRLRLRRIRRSYAVNPGYAPEPDETESKIPPAGIPRRPAGKRNGIAEGIRRIIFDEEGFRDPSLTLMSLAAKLGVNRTDLSRAINENTGKHFNRWLNEIRIREAACRLVESGRKYNITEIAYDTGFNDRTTFFRAFKKIIGCPPSCFSRSIPGTEHKKTGE